MNIKLRTDAETIARSAIEAVKPHTAVKRALEKIAISYPVYLVAICKAAGDMASAALHSIPVPIKQGIVITKYGHPLVNEGNIRTFEAGHPIPDEMSFNATQAVLDMTAMLTPDDTVLFLVSGGGSALFEKPLIESARLQEITTKLLGAGASIIEINAIRKRLSAVKGGKFATWCAPAKIEAIILSDILGDPLDMIASGPAAADPCTSDEVIEIAKKYSLADNDIMSHLTKETPKHLTNVRSQVIGSVRELCTAAANKAKELGYEPIILSDHVDCEARDAGEYLARELLARRDSGKPTAVIMGGETVVHIHGKGLGGRNQELALSAARLLNGVKNTAIISVGSDGTDGPTDAAGGYVDGETIASLQAADLDYEAMLADNDSYHALKAIDSLIITGPTGTNVNDVAIGLLQ